MLDTIDYAAWVNVIVLVSCDGRFLSACIENRKVHGKRVEVYGVPELTTNSLVNAASQFIPIEGDLLLG